MMTHLQMERVDALVRCMLDHVVEVMLKDENIIKTGLSPHERTIRNCRCT